ncbi:MAG: RluA family pseudouridine synthase [Blautia sp.]|nr:RluA family pseudouridine synthase [Blautia sp.]
MYEEDSLIICQVQEGEGSLRIDRFLSGQEGMPSRSFLQKLIGEGQITLDGKPVKANYQVHPGDRIIIRLPEPEELIVEAQDIPLDIYYEDEDILVINKPKGMVVHPAPGHTDGTLVNAILYHCRERLSGINGVLRPGIVHRIDQDTTGLIVVCKTDFAHHDLAMQFFEHTITRRYQALVYGLFREPEGTVNAPIGRHKTDRKRMAVNPERGKTAVTHYQVLESFEAKRISHIQCRLQTGRTHQIRVHMASIGHPLLGDEVYGNGKNPWHLQGQTLHAGLLGFIHPRSKEYMEFEAPLPDYFQNLLLTLRK